MKIVDRETFLKLPADTVFSKYSPCSFGELQIKGDTVSGDFWTQSIPDAIDASDTGEFLDILENARINGESIAMDFDCESRDGLFEESQLFAVWEQQDVLQLIERLQETLEG